MQNPYKRTPRQWKARLLDYEWIASQAGEMCYCLSNTTVQMILSITETFYWHTRWEGNEFFTNEQLDQIREWARKAEDEILSGCCGENTDVIKRVNPITGEYESSTDGGETWQPDPYSDPRNTSIQFPPLQGEDGDVKRCKAAENVTRMLQGNVTDFTAALGAITSYASFVLFLVGAFAVILSAGAALPFVAGLATLLISLGASVITATMTTEVYAAFKCIVYCEMGEDGVLPAGAISIIKEKMLEEIPEAYDILALLMDNYGVVGLNNLATLQGAGDGDSCEECDCLGEWCWFADFTGANARGFELDPIHGGVEAFGDLSGSGWECEISPPNSVSLLTISRVFATTQITRMTFNYSNTMDTSHSDDDYITCTPSLDGVEGSSPGIYNEINHTDAEWVVEFDPPVTCDKMFVDAKAGTFSPYGTCVIHSIKFEGIGEPIDTENCE